MEMNTGGCKFSCSSIAKWYFTLIANDPTKNITCTTFHHPTRVNFLYGPPWVAQYMQLK